VEVVDLAAEFEVRFSERPGEFVGADKTIDREATGRPPGIGDPRLRILAAADVAVMAEGQGRIGVPEIKVGVPARTWTSRAPAPP
jgi:hypothetical protein